jgi:serine/threonine-protein kinase RsbW
MDTFTFPGRYDSLEEIGDCVKKATASAGFDDMASYAIQTAVDEACTNIIEHAYRGVNNGQILICFEDNEKEFKVILRDNGIAFDPDSVPAPDNYSSLETIKERGLGLHFMKKLMDRVEFNFSEKTGNQLIMVKRKRKIN